MFLEGSEQLPVNEITCHIPLLSVLTALTHRNSRGTYYNYITRGIYIFEYSYYLLKNNICISGSTAPKM